MPTIYHSKGPPPWKNGGMTITQYESGLIRAEQSYYVPTATAQSFLPDFDLGKGIQVNVATEDGEAYIYPLPSLADLGNGFTNITVTAYARKPVNDGMIEKTYEVQSITKVDIVNDTLVFGQTQNYLFPLYRIVRASRQSDVPFLPNIEDLKNRDDIYRESDQQSIDPSIEFGNQKNVLFTSIQRSPTTGYGEIHEETFFVRFRPAEIAIPTE